MKAPATAVTVPRHGRTIGGKFDMSNRTCSIANCGKPFLARDMCSTHYSQWYCNGGAGQPRPKVQLRQRFSSKVDKTDSCWNWTGTTQGGSRGGYGQLWADGKMRQAHRVSYELHIGPIPDGLTIDHLCRNTRCVNPEHLEPVTQQENNHRGNTVSGVNSRKTKCHNGHELSGDNLRMWIDKRGRSHRHCRTCARDNMRRYRAQDN